MATDHYKALRRRVLDLLSDREPSATDTVSEPNRVADLALTWLDRWTEHGGSVIKRPDHSFFIGRFEYGDRPSSVRQLAHPDEDAWQKAWNDGCYFGTMREAEDFLRASPLLTIYVKAAVELAPDLGMAKPATV